MLQPDPEVRDNRRRRRAALLRRNLLSPAQLELGLAFPGLKRPPGRDRVLEALARDLLLEQGQPEIARKVQVEWSGRLRSSAGRAEYHSARVLLNCHLAAHGEPEIDRTLRHELAHLLAQARTGRRRIAPHGKEWRRACADLGIGDEKRCHDLPFPIHRLKRRYLYVCPNCRCVFPRTRPLRRRSACLACCLALNRGRYDDRFKLRFVRR